MGELSLVKAGLVCAPGTDLDFSCRHTHYLLSWTHLFSYDCCASSKTESLLYDNRHLFHSLTPTDPIIYPPFILVYHILLFGLFVSLNHKSANGFRF